MDFDSWDSWIAAITGGLLIGVAVSLMLVFNGRVTGISGILFQFIKKPFSENGQNVSFLAGLLSGGVLYFYLLDIGDKTAALNQPKSVIDLIIAGILVGFGTLLGNGCTSGHGVCGISRFSPRSLLATVTFILSGMVTTYILQQMGRH